ncbi:MAG: C69 family dipeptidase, partial [Synergistaceae bacterium]|nr:C69 family dipeptidase [Synergistaceae bacterium]
MSFLIFLAVFLFFMKADFSFACMTILVGKKASESGEILVGHNEDAPGRFVMQTHLVKKERRKPGTKIKFEPDLSEVELFNTRNNLFWSEAKTFNEDFSASAFCDFFVNGYGVVICSNNCEYSKEDSPELFNGGIGYGFRRLIAEKSHCAKEAVDIACNLIEKYGYSSSGRS